jgi:hypothetical protein
LVFLIPSEVASFLFYSYYSRFSSYYNYFPPGLFMVSTLTFLPLATLVGLYGFSGRMQTKIMILLLLLSALITGASAFYTTLVIPAGPCAEGVSAGGFPLPWYLTIIPYTGTGPYLPCPRFFDRSLFFGTLAVFSFLYDTVFYAGCGIVANEFYRGSRTLRLRSSAEIS